MIHLHNRKKRKEVIFWVTFMHMKHFFDYRSFFQLNVISWIFLLLFQEPLGSLFCLFDQRFQNSMVSVLDLKLSSPRKEVFDDAPACSMLKNELNQWIIFFKIPSSSLDAWLEEIVVVITQDTSCQDVVMGEDLVNFNGDVFPLLPINFKLDLNHLLQLLGPPPVLPSEPLKTPEAILGARSPDPFGDFLPWKALTMQFFQKVILFLTPSFLLNFFVLAIQELTKRVPKYLIFRWMVLNFWRPLMELFTLWNKFHLRSDRRRLFLDLDRYFWLNGVAPEG